MTTSPPPPTTKTVILRTGVHIAVPVLLLFAGTLYLKGHNAPGGGFIAGLLTAVAIVLRILAMGRREAGTEARRYVTVVAIGLAIGLATAATPAFLGYSFFTHTFGYVHVPLLGDVELASASLFDLGVYVVVVGNVVTVIAAMTERR
jgi:multicomponent Na+:H+ antiporter subunit B